MSLILTLDAASMGVGAALFQVDAAGEQLLAGRRLEFDRAGEGLAPLAAQILAEAGAAPRDLTLIATTTGPGSFVGARIGPAFARGLALACGARAMGVGVLEALAEAATTAAEGAPLLVALDAKREALYAQGFQRGAALWAPREIPLSEAATAAPEGDFALIGSGAALWLAASPAEAPRARRLAPEFDRLRLESLARIARRRLDSGAAFGPPSPLYLRAPDAKPSPDHAA